MEMHRNATFRYGLVFCLLTVASAAAAQSGSIHQQIEQTYNFQPHLLSSQQITDKSAVLDKFWRKTNTEPTLYVAALPPELGDFKNPPFFLHVAGPLLLPLSHTPPDPKTAPSSRTR